LFKDVILNYKKGYKFGKSAKKFKWKQYVDIKKLWNKQNPLLIVDEAHEFTNSNAVKVKALQHHKHFFDYRYFLSATPALNTLEKWWVSMNLLDGGSIPMSENAFKIDIASHIGNKYGMYNITRYSSTKIKEFKDNVLTKYVLRREKHDLPEIKFKQIVEPVYVKMPTLHQKLYQIFTQEEIQKVTREFDKVTLSNIMNNFPYLIQIIDNPLLLRGKVTNEKFDSLLNKWSLDKDPRIEYLDSTLDEKITKLGGKVVIFDNHPATIDQLALRYVKYNPLILHGQMGDSEKEKFDKSELFNDTKSKYKLFIANPQVAGVGISLNKGSDTIIFYTMPNNAVLYAQALDRCDRINNTRDSLIQILVVDMSLDVIRYKRNIQRILFNKEYLTKSLTKKELQDLLMGMV
jgi:hypothetical protein